MNRTRIEYRACEDEKEGACRDLISSVTYQREIPGHEFFRAATKLVSNISQSCRDAWSALHSFLYHGDGCWASQGGVG